MSPFPLPFISLSLSLSLLLQVRLSTGKYRDVAPVGPREEVIVDSPATKNKERQVRKKQ